MATTTHLGITLVEQSQAQKEVTVNQAITRIDAVLNTGAISRTVNTPPGSPSEGDVYIVGPSPTGDWAGHANHVTYYDQIWRFIIPNEGIALWVNNEDRVYYYTGSTWLAGGAGQAEGAFANKFRNAAFDVWQRGTSGTITAGTPAHAADGWVISASGANVAWSQAIGKSLAAYSLRITGAASVTNTFIRQRIEGFLSYPLAGKTITFQAQIYNNTGAAITPTITVKHAGSVDNWSSPVTDVNAQNLQLCADASWTQVSYSFTASASSGNGLEVSIDFGGTLNNGSKYIQVTECDIRNSSSVDTPALRPVSAELVFNQRYYRRLGGSTNFLIGTGHNLSSTMSEIITFYETEMRAAPTITNSATNIIKINSGGAQQTSTAISWSVVTTKNAYVAITVGSVTIGDGCIAYLPSAGSYVEFSAEI